MGLLFPPVKWDVLMPTCVISQVLGECNECTKYLQGCEFAATVSTAATHQVTFGNVSVLITETDSWPAVLISFIL